MIVNLADWPRFFDEAFVGLTIDGTVLMKREVAISFFGLFL